MVVLPNLSGSGFAGKSNIVSPSKLRAAIPYFKTMLYTGSRPSEVLRLVWRDVDLERGVVAVWQEKMNTRKTVPISKAFREVLSGLRRGVGTAPLFVRPDG